MVRLALILSLLSVVNCQISFFGGEVEEEDNSCTTPFNKQGKCVGLRQCGNVLSLLKKPIPEEVIGYLRKSVCSFTGFLPDVCCPEEKPTFGEVTTKATITTTTTTTSTPETVKGSWSAWSPYSSCTVTCGGGTQFRTRACSKEGECDGDEREEQECGAAECEVHGAWSTWGEWSTCSVSCGEGDQARDRECNSPAPSNDGDECEGEARETQNCNTDECPQLVEIPTECGKAKVGSNRIVNGKPAKRNAWPWLAALGYTDPNTGDVQYLCGATLVSAKHVVTAAHCIRDDMVTVLLGEHVIGNDTDGVNPEEFRVVKMTKHEKYNSRTFENDIALVEFETEVTFKKGIQPVCLPSKTPALLEENLVEKGVYIAGWGATSFRGPTSNLLLQGIISVVSNKECKERFSQFNNVEIGDTKICARDVNDKIDACQGDSGGPMVYLKKADDKKFRYHLIGVVSFGYRCAVKGFPGVYTRVTEYDQWIRDTVNK
eukprot:GFUD01004529.1.p1 GENE.GFUD01004529.1~~GFUD01004529.1.p1  ORF type:complete len:488 (+),score=127.45 GFUD01004529.1:318-1781(+)